MEEITIRNYRIAAILMFMHGTVMEIGGVLAGMMLPLMAGDRANMGQYFSFIVPYLQANLPLMLVMGIIFGVVRIIGAVGLWRNRMWGLALALINCIITMALMLFMLPAGIIDGVLACSALILILIQYFGTQKIIK